MLGLCRVFTLTTRNSIYSKNPIIYSAKQENSLKCQSQYNGKSLAICPAKYVCELKAPVRDGGLVHELKVVGQESKLERLTASCKQKK